MKKINLVQKETYWAFEYYDERFESNKELAVGTREYLMSMLVPNKNEDGTDQKDLEGNVINGIYPFIYEPEG